MSHEPLNINEAQEPHEPELLEAWQARHNLARLMPADGELVFTDNVSNTEIYSARSELVEACRLMDISRMVREQDLDFIHESVNCTVEAMSAIENAVNSQAIPLDETQFSRRMKGTKGVSGYEDSDNQRDNEFSILLSGRAKTGKYDPRSRTVFIYNIYKNSESREKTRSTLAHEMIHALSTEWMQYFGEDNLLVVGVGIPDSEVNTALGINVEEALTEIASRRVLEHEGYCNDCRSYDEEVRFMETAESLGIINIDKLLAQKFATEPDRNITGEELAKLIQNKESIEQEK